MKKDKIIYYKDELNDDFANTNIKTVPLFNKFKYIRTNIFYNIGAFLLEWCIAKPLVFVVVKLFYGHRLKNKRLLKKYKGAYIYANHSHAPLDAFIPNVLKYFKRSYIVVGPDTYSLKGLRTIVQMLGAIPLGSTLSQKKDMYECVYKRVENNFVTIYPEAHIWPYYTKVRKFPSFSFYFPSYKKDPVFTLTNCYQKRKFSSKPKMISYIDGPFFMDSDLDLKQNMNLLSKTCYEKMCERCEKYSTYEYIKYIKEDKKL